MDLLNDGVVIINEPLPQHVPLSGGDARVQGSQFPEGDNLITQGRAGILRSLGVGIDLLC